MQVTPTRDVEVAKQCLSAEGFALFESGLTSAEIRAVRERLIDGVSKSEADGVPTRGYPFDTDTRNQRVFHLFNLDPIFSELIQRPIALELVRHLLGNAFLISNFSANITAPGSQRMQLHADQGYVMGQWPAQPLACNVAWLLDDFTVENGGTCYVPRSHCLGRNPSADETYATVPIEAPAGSLLIMDGRLWHQTGENRSRDCHRAALFGYYVLRWLRPQINWNAALWPETIASLNPAFLDLLGYYSGNVEAQIPNGHRATIPTPEVVSGAQDKRFALAAGGARQQ